MRDAVVGGGTSVAPCVEAGIGVNEAGSGVIVNVGCGVDVIVAVADLIDSGVNAGVFVLVPCSEG